MTPSLEDRIKASHTKLYGCREWHGIEYDDRTSVGQKVHLVGRGCQRHHIFIETAVR